MGADYRTDADTRSVQYRGLHTDQHRIFNYCTVDYGAVADHAVISDDGCIARISMHNGAVLNIASASYRNLFGVAAQHGIVPNRAVLADAHRTDHMRARCDENRFRQLGLLRNSFRCVHSVTNLRQNKAISGMHRIFTGIRRIYGHYPATQTLVRGKEMQEVPFIDHAWLEVQNGRISAIGSMEALPENNHAERIDLNGAWIMPGFVDSHTHIVFAATREEEFRMRIAGRSYEEIAAAGGGIINSALRLRQTDEDALFDAAAARLRLMMAHGTTCVEVKSGYGLDTDSELRMLRVIRRLAASFPIPVRSTFLGAHAIPPEYKENRQGYIELLCQDMLPRIAEENLADFVDVFCDRGYFTPEETLHICETAAGYGLRPKIHANELGYTGGVQAGVQAGALSVDHLEHCGEDEIACLLNSNTLPVALPGCSYFLGIPFAPLREMIDRGLPVVLASDFNPGSSPGPSLQMVWSLACARMKLLPEEAFNAITLNAAAALDLSADCGSLSPGKRADFLIMQGEPSLSIVPYHFGVNHVKEVYLAGERFEG
jgi:imidazolonepropionase